jgi:hypothetical protein
VTGVRLARSRGHAVDPTRNPVLRLFRRYVPMTDDYRGAAFVVREGGRRLATPLLAVLAAIETTDVMFALDSIPAVFAVTTDPFVVFSSNLFAILGLRSMYFLFAGLLDRFVYLKLGLALLLVFAGVKILVGLVDVHIPIWLSLSVISGILGTAIAASLIATHPRRRAFVMPLVRILSGVAMGALVLGWFAFAAAIRDGHDLWWLLIDAAILVAATTAVVVGGAELRRAHARATVVRGWASIGALTLLALAVVLVLD